MLKIKFLTTFAPSPKGPPHPMDLSPKGARAKALREMMGPQRVERQKGGLLEAAERKNHRGKVAWPLPPNKKWPFFADNYCLCISLAPFFFGGGEDDLLGFFLEGGIGDDMVFFKGPFDRFLDFFIFFWYFKDLRQ